MIRRVLCIPLLLLGLPACSPDPAAQQQAQVAEKLNAALAHLSQATSLDDEQQQIKHLDQAAATLKPIVRQGSKPQQLASRIALSQAHAARADQLSRQAIDLWTSQAEIVTEATGALGATLHAQGLSAAHATTDHTLLLGDLQDKIVGARRDSEQASANVEELTKQTRAIDARIARHLTDRQAQIEAADRLKHQAFAAEGRLELDLTLSAAEHVTEADRLGAEADRSVAEREILQDQLAIARAQQDSRRHHVESLQAAIDDFGNREEGLEQRTVKFEATAAALRVELQKQFEQLAAHFGQISEILSEAERHMQDAVSALDGIQQLAALRQRDQAELEIGLRKAESGQLLWRHKLLLSGYRELLAIMVAQGEGVMSDRAPLMQETLDRTDAQCSEALDAAEQQLREAADTLRNVKDRTSDRRTRFTATRHLISVVEPLMVITGEPSYQTELEALQEEADGMRRQLQASDGGE